jgi:pectin methylesterase-like acyl-CoA thioesterase
VAPGGSIQKAVDALPLSGGEVTLQPGTYREVVTIRKPHVHLHGADADPAKTVIVYNNGANNSGGTFNSATVFVEVDDVTIDHLSIVNDLGAGKGQGVALHVTGDRAIFRNLRITGAQDTLFAASRYCYGDYGPCVAARQYFADSYIEGNTDFIFGDSMAVFDRCEIHGIDTGSVMYTAQSRHTAEQTDSGYIFDHCHLTGKARSNGAISLGRSWRPYATVVFLNAQIDAPVIPAGWTEWARFGIPTLPTAFYAEYGSAGPGADAKNREPYSHQLTPAEAEQWSPRKFLAGKDSWMP